MIDDSGEWLALNRRNLFRCFKLAARISRVECARRQVPLEKREHTWGHVGPTNELVGQEFCLSGECLQGKENLITLKKRAVA